VGEYLKSLAGTATGEDLALALALLSGLAHAVFGAINKGGMDPYFNRGAINVSYSLMAAPFALFVVPWPTGELWVILFVAFFVHVVYEWLQTVSFSKGAFTVVYPIARGTGPMITAFAALLIFKEHLASLQWFGLAMLSGSIIALAWVNYREAIGRGQDISGLKAAVSAAFLTGIMIAVYTTIDAYGIRLAENPFTFLAWFFMMGGFGFPLIALHRWRRTSAHPPASELLTRGILGAIIGMISFGAVMLATLLGGVAQAAALRETSIIFATGIGVLIFKEKTSVRALMLIGFIALGAVLVKVG